MPDSLAKGLRVVFVGFNPSPKSAETGFNYAGPSNRFWRVLFESGLTPTRLEPKDGPGLLSLGYGFTNIVQRPTRSAADIRKEEYAEGRVQLLEKLAKYRPSVACYVGKGVYERAALRGAKWGWQEESVVEGVRDFVAPSTSGLVRMRLEEQVAIFKELRAWLDGSEGR